jgi:choline dehydrogenase-like flavoprotein
MSYGSPIGSRAPKPPMKLARPAIGRRGAGSSPARHAHLQPVDPRHLSQGIGGAATPDMQVTFARGSFSRAARSASSRKRSASSAGAWQMRPLSRSYVEAKSNRPGDAPAINPRYLSEESNRRAIIGGLRLVRRMFAAPALQRFVREESLPGAETRPTTNCSITRGATAAPAITPAVPASWARTR